MARLGEVIPSWNGDDVFTGLSLTAHTSQMNLKLEKPLTAGLAAALGACLIAISPAVNDQVFYQEISDTSRLDNDIQAQQKNMKCDENKKRESVRRNGYEYTNHPVGEPDAD